MSENIKLMEVETPLWNCIVDVEEHKRVDFVQKNENNKIVVDCITRNAKTLFPFTQDDLAGYRPENSKLSGGFYIAAGCVVKTELDDNKDIHVTMRSLQKGDDVDNQNQFCFYVKKENEFYQKAMNLNETDKITVLMHNDTCIDLKLGPYFGYASWSFCHDVNDCAITEFRVRT